MQAQAKDVKGLFLLLRLVVLNLDLKTICMINQRAAWVMSNY